MMVGGGHHSGKALVRAAKRGSAEATEALVRSQWPNCYRLAVSIVADPVTAEDVAQEALMAALANLGSFESRKPLEPWLHTIVTRKALDSIRSRQRRSEVELRETPAAASSGSDYQLSPDLEIALQALDDRARAVVVLRHVFGYSAAEVGKVVGTSEVNVRSILHRSLIQMRSQLEPMSKSNALTEVPDEQR